MKERTKSRIQEDFPMSPIPEAPRQPKNYMQPLLIVLLVAASFIIGTLWTKVQVLEKGGAVAGAGDSAQPAAVDPGAQGTGEEPLGEVPPITKDDHVRGDRNAQIALIEYSDSECPYCQRFHPTAQQIVDTYDGKVMWIWRHFPLSFHVNAQKEAEAMECANELGGNDAFWKYLDTIFERSETGGTGFALDKLVPLAGELGLDQAKFKECLDSGKYEKNVKDEMAAGSTAGVSGTPGNILLNTKSGDKKLIPGAVPFEQFKQAIDEMLK